MVDAMIGYATVFAVLNPADPDGFSSLAEVTEITPPAESTEAVDFTHSDSPDRTREAGAGLRDPGDLAVSLSWLPGSATDAFIRAWRGVRPSRITAPNGVELNFEAFVTGYSGAMPLDGKMTAELTCKVTSGDLGDAQLDFTFLLNSGYAAILAEILQ